MNVAQSCLTLCNPVDCSSPGSSVHEISQAKILKWVAISSSAESSQPRNWTQVSCIAGILYHLTHQGSPFTKDCSEKVLPVTGVDLKDPLCVLQMKHVENTPGER